MGATPRIYNASTRLMLPVPSLLLIQHDEKEKYLTNMKQPELTRLLDFLDNVCAVLHSFVDLVE